jgi:hypothetical protein
MSADDKIAEAIDWIPLKRYLELYKETEGAVKQRCLSGAWKKGTHWNVPPGAGKWLSLRAINAWAASQAAQAEQTQGAVG